MCHRHPRPAGGSNESPLPSASVNTGEFSLLLRQVSDLAPVAQVAVYAVMPSGEAVADSQDLPVQLCLNNKVQLRSLREPAWSDGPG